ncbi:hypothetical protein, partial [Noviherbaspirillum sp. Root189]|uniref:hypothetical protein n=1 Tax=Noviherbaspirillum sp. Root189 TaxID=1736487 RepID=UPI001F2A36C5
VLTLAKAAIKDLRGQLAEMNQVKQDNEKLKQALAVKDRELKQEKALSERLRTQLDDVKQFMKEMIPDLSAALREKMKAWLKGRERGGPSR